VTTVFGVPLPAILGQLMLGLVNGSFYALLSLGLAVIFGLLGVVNFAHGAFYMLGAFAAYIGLASFGINYWWALLLAPLTVGLLGIVIERLFLRHLYQVEPVYGLLLTFGIALIAEGVMRSLFGASGKSYPVPLLLQGGFNLGFMVLPIYRAWVILASVTVCGVTWFLIERTRLGSRLRAATENAKLVQAFGINVPMLVMCTYGAGVALAALAGVLAAPVVQVSPLMGSSLVIVVFAVVVIGGMGSILGAIVSGLVLGLIEGLTKVIYPEASNIVVFVIMAVVLIWRPAGLFGKEQ
jgi:branched-chain amino acid transport system permease protein